MRKRMTDEEFERIDDMFIRICEIVYPYLKKGEYCRTCKDTFDYIEKNRIDISSVVSDCEYLDLKKKMIDNGCTGIPMGDVPKPKYNTDTVEGRMAFYRDNPEKRNMSF